MKFIFGAIGKYDDSTIKLWISNVNKYFSNKNIIIKNTNNSFYGLLNTDEYSVQNDFFVDGYINLDKQINYNENLTDFFTFYKFEENKITITNDFRASHNVYFYSNKEIFYFSNNLQLLLLNELIPFELNENAVFEFCNPTYVYGENEISNGQTFFNNIYKLQPYSILTYENGNLSITKKINNKKLFMELNKLKYIDSQKKSCDAFRFELNSIIKTLSNNDKNKLILSFSAGLDSSVLLASIIDVGVKNYEIYSFVFGEEYTQSNDIDLIKETADYLGINVNIIDAKDFLAKNNFYTIGWFIDGPNTLGVDSAYRYLNSLLNNDDNNIVLTGTGGDELFCGTKYSSDYFLKSKEYKQYFQRVKKLANLQNQSFLKVILYDLFIPQLPIIRNIGYKKLFWENDLNEYNVNLSYYINYSKINFKKSVFRNLNNSKCLKNWYKRYMYDYFFPRCSSLNVNYKNFNFINPLESFQIYELANKIPPVFHYDINRGKLGSYEISKQILRKSYNDILPKFLTEKKLKSDYGSVYIDMFKINKEQILNIFNNSKVYLSELGIIDLNLFKDRLNKTFLNLEDPQYVLNSELAFLPRLVSMEFWLQSFFKGRYEFLFNSLKEECK